jgi:hypothetical protein
LAPGRFILRKDFIRFIRVRFNARHFFRQLHCFSREKTLSPSPPSPVTGEFNAIAQDAAVVRPLCQAFSWAGL